MTTLFEQFKNILSKKKTAPKPSGSPRFTSDYTTVPEYHGGEADLPEDSLVEETPITRIDPDSRAADPDSAKPNVLRTLWKRVVGHFPFLRSLRLRIFMLIFVVGLVPGAILRYGILNNYETRVVNLRISDVQTQLRVLSNHLITYDYLSDPTSEVVNAELEQFASFYDGRVLIMDDDLHVIKDTFNQATGKIMVSSDVIGCLQKGNQGITSRYDREDSYIEVVIPILETVALESGDYSEQGEELLEEQQMVRGVILASVSADNIIATIQILARRSTLLWIILVLFVFAIAVLMSGAALRPFEKLTREIGDVRAGFSSKDIHVNDYLETEHISDAFNQVLGRMRTLDESRSEFVSNVSHELKTPMTSMKVLADSLLQQGEGVPEEMYREFLSDIDKELDRENNMIAELLTLARMDRKQVQMNVSSVNIGELLETVMKRIRPLALQKDVELTLISERDVVAEVDEIKMNTIFTNLIENAVKYNKDHGKVTVALNADHKNFVLTVEDTGIGIPEEAAGRVFERFYRVDKSRSREIGGTGLGLSITKSAVLLHKGTITVESAEEEGTKFTVTIPLTYIRGEEYQQV